MENRTQASNNGRADASSPSGSGGTPDSSPPSLPVSRTTVRDVLLLLVLLGIGLVTYRRYGMCPDDIVNWQNGRMAYRYAVHGDPALETWRDRYYGTALEQVLYGLQKALRLTDSRDVFLFRHLAVFLLFWGTTVVFYTWARRHWRDAFVPLAAVLMLVFMPRIYAHAFFNSKDIGLLCFYLLAFCTLARWLRTHGPASALLHAAVCAYLVDIRIIGIAAIAVTAGMMVLELFFDPRCRTVRFGVSIALYAVITPLLIAAFWPLLWKHPVANFVHAFRQMSRYPWNGSVLFFGRLIPAADLPRTYVPVWMTMTIPPVYLLAALLGTAELIASLRTGLGVWYRRHRSETAAAALAAAPLAAVIVLRPVLYDGWRHMYFVYGPLVVLAAHGIYTSRRRLSALWPGWRGIHVPVRIRRFSGRVFRGVLLLQFLFVLAFMVRTHPYQHVYFNVFGPDLKEARRYFDVDYWGLSYPEALRRIVTQDDQPVIPVFLATTPGEAGAVHGLILPKAMREKLKFADSAARADWFLSTWRWHPDDYPWQSKAFTVRAAGADICVVYDLRRERARLARQAQGAKSDARKGSGN